MNKNWSLQLLGLAASAFLFVGCATDLGPALDRAVGALEAEKGRDSPADTVPRESAPPVEEGTTQSTE